MVCILPETKEKVVRLNVAVYNPPIVHIFKSCNHLICKEQYSLQREPTGALVELILEAAGNIDIVKVCPKRDGMSQRSDVLRLVGD